MKDRFSERAKAYALFRPRYPDELYQYVLAHTSGRDAAWDVGTGNGQVARVLANHFHHVLATDISESQLHEASQASNIDYQISSASRCPSPGHSFDLITVGQALHWFDLNGFFSEVDRVAQPAATVAVWGYSLCSVSSEIDPMLNHFYHEVVGPYWDAERKSVDDHYRSFSFPGHWTEITSPVFFMVFEWGLDQMAGYLSTWSAVRNFFKAEQRDPVAPLLTKFIPHWPQVQRVRFPLFLRLFKINAH